MLHIDIPTVLQCLLASWLVIFGLTFLYWLQDRSKREYAYWSLGMGIAAFGSLLLSLRLILPSLVSIGLGNAVLLSGMGFLYTGFRVFDGLPLHIFRGQVCAVLWMVCYFFMPGFQTDINLRIVVISLFFLVILLMAIQSIVSKSHSDPLPSRLILAATLCIDCAVSATRIPLAIWMPLTNEPLAVMETWNGLANYLFFITTLIDGFCLFALGRERIMAQYKLASEIDMLTGILNRRAFYAALDSRVLRQGGTLALLDIDHFKAVNDSHGHAGGDRLLCGFVAAVKDSLDPNMFFGRLGGEEFAIFLPGLTADQAFLICERVRKNISRSKVAWNDTLISMSVSIGICEIAANESGAARGPHAQDPVLMLDMGFALADKALYQAKHHGRNKTIIAKIDDDIPSPVFLDEAASPKPNFAG